jgi:DNA-binding NarL/FixJ family response regulator
MRVLVLDTPPWRELAIVRMLGRSAGMTAFVESNAGGDWHATEAAVILVSESSLKDDRRSIENLKSSFPTANILILGDNADATTIGDFVKRGADGYFTMSDGDEKLVKAINVVARGGFWLPEDAARSVSKALRGQPQSREALTHEELTILRLLDEALSNDEIASRLGVSDLAVKQSVRHLLRRFRVRTRVHLIAKAKRSGIVDR